MALRRRRDRTMTPPSFTAGHPRVTVPARHTRSLESWCEAPCGRGGSAGCRGLGAYPDFVRDGVAESRGGHVIRHLAVALVIHPAATRWCRSAPRNASVLHSPAASLPAPASQSPLLLVRAALFIQRSLSATPGTRENLSSEGWQRRFWRLARLGSRDTRTRLSALAISLN